MKVIAIAKGYDNRAVREPGEEFDMPVGSKGSWFIPVEEKKITPAATSKPAANTAPAQKSEEPSYDDMLARAKELGIEFTGRPKKADLIAAIKDAEEAITAEAAETKEELA